MLNTPKKLLHSKWTAKHVNNKEKHFLIVKVSFDEEDQLEECIIEAVFTKRQQAIDWQELKDTEKWLVGWQ